ncbi:hypothetical protein EIP91_000465 [Steccherinum ochraceum]|uniref:Protein kinase domain-containing protein n=1 Tax=Steccherinum ochraceum TaxID=92696 RepID=A0A4R0RM87_9APHY|nr:hypothetical protein EIP91_000465 [Steccherinum ochraceum]
MQGGVIPKLYGVLYGRKHDKSPVLCLVLERFGNRLQGEFRHLDASKKAKILNKLVEAHHGGLLHLDFAERNVVEKDGDFRIIDLRHAQNHPECRWTYDFEKHIGDSTVADDDPTVRCSALMRHAEEMEFWDHGVVYLCRVIIVPKNDKLPDQSVIEQLDTSVGIGTCTNYHPNDLATLAVRYFEEMKARLDEGAKLKDLIRLRPQITYQIHKRWHEEQKIDFIPSDQWDYSGRRSLKLLTC